MITPTDHQFAGIKSIQNWYADDPLNSGHFYLSGYAGTGKSTILAPILEQLQLVPNDVAFCAPTGKAAQVMRQKLKAAGIGTECKTIHSAIYLPNADKAQTLHNQLLDLENQADEIIRDGGVPPAELDAKIAYIESEMNTAVVEDDGPHFTLNIDSQIQYKKLIICDEASMVGGRLARDLKSFNVPVLAIGDAAQLPPVKDDGEGLTGGEPDFFLREIHRQAKDNPIIRLATMAREYKDIPLGNYGNGVKVVRLRDDDVTLNPNIGPGEDLQVLVGTNKRRWRLTRNMREAFGYTTTGPSDGEPLIVVKNSRFTPSLVNGTIIQSEQDTGDLVKGRASFHMKIKEPDKTERNISVLQGKFEENYMEQKNGFSATPRQVMFAKKLSEEVDYAWAITVHKSQGSQWGHVCLHDESGVFGAESARWLYTGITRAANKLTLVYP